MQLVIHRYLLLLTGVMLALIGLAYCLDPNLLLSRYEVAVAGPSEDNMYRGAYGGLFITLGAAISYGYHSSSFRQTATLIALLFMAGFAAGRLSSLVFVGIPHENILGLFMFEVVTAAVFLWLWFTNSRLLSGPSNNAGGTA